MSERTKQRLAWIGIIGCEGGPVMVVDRHGFAQWTGSTPFAELCELEPKRKDQFENRRTMLHYWGQFTDELPAPFGADGGHQFVRCASESDARAKLVELREAVTKKFPDVEVRDEGGGLQFFRRETGARLFATLSPASEYDASWQANRDAESWVHAFGRSGRGLFWEPEGAGRVDVGVSDDGSELVLVRSWLSGNDESERDEKAAVRALVDSKSEREQPEAELVIPTGEAVIVWSPVAAGNIVKLGDDALPTTLDTGGMRGIGTLLRVKAGRYAVTLANTDDDADDGDRPFACRWCRLTWMGDT